MPQIPNFKPGVGKLATDRYDFNKHLDGSSFRHTAPQIDLSPSITIGAAVFTDVQSIISFLSGTVVVPTVPDATTVSKGIIQLGGDLTGIGTTALNPIVSGIQGRSVSNTLPTLDNVLRWNGTTWVPNTLPQATNTVPVGGIVLAGDLGGGAVAPTVVGLQTRPVSSTTPSTNQVLAWNGTQWAPASAAGTPAATTIALGTVQLAGDLNGSGTTATAPRVGSINSASVPAAGALTTSHVLQVSGASALTYGFIADANVSATAAIAGSKVNPNFGSQALTAGVSVLGNTTTGTLSSGTTTTGALTSGTLTAGTTTSVNSIVGSLKFTTRTVSVSFTVDTGTTDSIILVDTNAPVTITLPTPTNGRKLVIKDIIGLAGTNNISLAQHASEKIEGLAATKALSVNWGSWTVISNGTDWFLI